MAEWHHQCNGHEFEQAVAVGDGQGSLACCSPWVMKIEGRERRGQQRKDEMVGWHHQLNGHEFEQALGVDEEQGSLAGCSPWDCKESDTTERLN